MYCIYSDTEISWIQSLIVIFWMMIGAPISKQIIPKIGYRWTLWIGGFLMMIGAVSSSMVTSIYYLYGTMGVIFGMGVGLCYLPHLLVAGEYFNEQRNNAFAIISSGNFFTDPVQGSTDQKVGPSDLVCESLILSFKTKYIQEIPSQI